MLLETERRIEDLGWAADHLFWNSVGQVVNGTALRPLFIEERFALNFPDFPWSFFAPKTGTLRVSSCFFYCPLLKYPGFKDRSLLFPLFFSWFVFQENEHQGGEIFRPQRPLGSFLNDTLQKNKKRTVAKENETFFRKPNRSILSLTVTLNSLEKEKKKDKIK